MPRPKPTMAQYRETYAGLIRLVESGVGPRKACKLIGMSYSNACNALRLCGYRLKWVKDNDDGTENHFDAW